MSRPGLLLLASFASLLLTTTAARAESLEPTETSPMIERGYVSLGGLAGVDHIFRLGASLEAGVRMGSTPLFLHALFSAGEGAAFLNEGSYRMARVGVEGRHCFATSLPLCAFGGLDVGLSGDKTEREAFSMGSSSHDDSGSLIVPRAGLELGRTIRARVAVEAPLYIPDGEGSLQPGGAMQLGVGYAF